MSRDDAQGEAGSRDDSDDGRVKVSNHERISNASFSSFRSLTTFLAPFFEGFFSANFVGWLPVGFALS